MNISNQAMYAFIKGMKAVHKKDAEALKNIISKMENDRLNVANQLTTKEIALCSGTKRSAPTQLDVDQAKVMELELRALLANMNKDKSLAEKYLKEAVELEDKISYSYGPPSIVKPTFELYGEWLLENNKAEEALVMFDKSLKRAPNRVLSLKGKLEVAKKMKNEKMVKEIQEVLDGVQGKKVNQV